MKRLILFLYLKCILIVLRVHGNDTNNIGTRIVGGYAIAITNAPYQVSLRINGNHTCGASIISQDWILTAAQCAVTHPITITSFKIGSADRLTGGIVMYPALKLLHPSYNAVSKDYDVAVYKLTISISFSALGGPIRNILLPNANQTVPVGTLCLATGWGVLKDGTTALPIRLQGVSVPTVSQSSCQASYGTLGITARMICAGYSVGGRDVCDADTGGPLVATLAGVKKQVGIISWGNSCAAPKWYGVYTFVPAVRAWIKAITGV